MIPRRARVCIVAPEFIGPFPNGGVGTACYWEASSLAAAGFDVTVLYTGPTDRETPEHWERTYAAGAFDYVDLMKWARGSGDAVAVERVQHPCAEARTSELVLRYLRTNPFDLLLFQEFLGHGARTLQARRSGDALADVPAAVTLHSCRQWIYQGMQRTSASRDDLHVDFLERESARLADYVNAPSQHMSDWVQAHWRLEAPATVVPYCFDASTEGTAPQIEHAGPFEHLVFFGRLETRKGIQLLCRALAASPDARGPVRKVTFLGKRSTVEGRPSEDFIRETLAAVQGLEIEIIDTFGSFEALEWIGQQRGTLVVAPSMVDNLPYAVIELFTRRIPFITTKIGGIPEIVGPDNDHVLAEATVDGLASRLAQVHRDGCLAVDYRRGYSSAGATADHVDYVYSMLRWRQAAARPSAELCDVVLVDAEESDIDIIRDTFLTSDPTAYDARFVSWDTWRHTRNTSPAIFVAASVTPLAGLVRRMLNALQDSRVDVASSYYTRQSTDETADVAPLGASLECGWAANVFGGPCLIAAPSAFDAIKRGCRGTFRFWPAYAAAACARLGSALLPEVLYTVNADAADASPQDVDTVLGLYATNAVGSIDLGWVLKAARHGSPSGQTTAESAGRALYDRLLAIPEVALKGLAGMDLNHSDPMLDSLLRVRAQLRELVGRWTVTVPRVFVYGAGEHTRAILALEPELGRFIAGFVDRRTVSEFLGRPCVRPDDVTSNMADVILYSSREFERDMYTQVAHLAIEHIMLYSASPAPRTASNEAISATAMQLRRRLKHTSAPVDGLRAMYKPPAWATGYISGGDTEFLLELVTGVRPESVLELGVASGASSAALLFALDHLPPTANGRSLLSCDVRPSCYFDNTRGTGSAVDEMYPGHQTRWTLNTDTDARRLSQSIAPATFDLLFIDANHSHPWPLLDLLHLVHVAKPGAWVALHDIQLPILNPSYQVYGPMWLFDAWPFDKEHGLDGSRNIGAVQLPDDLRQLVPMARELFERSWEHAPTAWDVSLPEIFRQLADSLEPKLKRLAPAVGQ